MIKGVIFGIVVVEKLPYTKGPCAKILSMLFCYLLLPANTMGPCGKFLDASFTNAETNCFQRYFSGLHAALGLMMDL